MTIQRARGVSAVQRFWERAQIPLYDIEGCWPFEGVARPAGTIQFRANGRLVLCHRFSYELHNGPIPEGWVIHHECGNRICVNPDHLTAMPHSDHARHHMEERHPRLKTAPRCETCGRPFRQRS